MPIALPPTPSYPSGVSESREVQTLPHHLPDRQFILLADRHCPGQFLADQRRVNAQQLGQAGLAAGASVVVERFADAADCHAVIHLGGECRSTEDVKRLLEAARKK